MRNVKRFHTPWMVNDWVGPHRWYVSVDDEFAAGACANGVERHFPAMAYALVPIRLCFSAGTRKDVPRNAKRDRASFWCSGMVTDLFKANGVEHGQWIYWWAESEREDWT